MKPHRRRVLFHTAGVLALGLTLAAAVVVSGITSIAASAGHWPFMDVFLHFAAKRSIATHSIGIDVPRLDDPSLQALGASHYRLQCQNCHGGPGVPKELTYQSMVPVPPDLAERVPGWSSAELYWIVQHGIKYTAMPAWPTQRRKDEAWAVVAFLLELPKMEAARYTALTGDRVPRDGDAFSLALATCVSCHGEHGEGRGTVPRIGGQSLAYLSATLAAYAEGDRNSGFMQALAAALKTSEREALARHFAGREHISPSRRDVDAAAWRRGRAIALEGIEDAGVPACQSCHGAAGGAPVNAQYPSLWGQTRPYLDLQLRLFRDGGRGGTPHVHLMEQIAGRLTDEQARDLAVYFSAGETDVRGGD